MFASGLLNMKFLQLYFTVLVVGLRSIKKKNRLFYVFQYLLLKGNFVKMYLKFPSIIFSPYKILPKEKKSKNAILWNRIQAIRSYMFHMVQIFTRYIISPYKINTRVQCIRTILSMTIFYRIVVFAGRRSRRWFRSRTGHPTFMGSGLEGAHVHAYKCFGPTQP